jgi:hypothetical protein
MSAGAQSTPTYKLVNLGTLGNEGDEDSRAYGLNSFGEVVGESGYLGEPIAQLGRAFVWLPEARLGLPQGMTNLGALGSTSRADHVNDFLHVVGTAAARTRPFIWTPASFDGIPALTQHELGLMGTVESFAWQITNDAGTHQWVVGEKNSGCGLWDAFIWKSETPGLVTILEPPQNPPNPLTQTGAAAINPRAVTGTTPRVAGYGRMCVTSGFCGLWDSSALEWTPNLSVFGSVLPVPRNTNGRARDITDLDIKCGWWEDPDEDDNGVADVCHPRSSFWVAVGHVDLHATTGLPVTEASFAEAMNDTSFEVVGWQIGLDDPSATLWRLDADWSVTDLNGEVSVLCNFRLLEAHDINDDGWIVGAGDADPGGQDAVRGFLLIPFEDIDCPEDVSRDGVVDGADLQFVINASNQPPELQCEPGRICWEDVNGDCRVNNNDIKLVMKAFGPCGGTGSGLTGFDLDLWMEAGGTIGFAEGTITAEQICSCLGLPTPAHRFAALFTLLNQ